MRPTRSWWAWLAVAGLGMSLAGCGGSNSAEEDVAPEGVPPEMAAAEAGSMEPSNVNPVEAPPAAAPLAESAPAEPAAPPPAPAASASTSETDQMLALANSAPTPAAPSAPAAGGPNANPGAMPGMSMPGQPGMDGTAANDMAMMNSQPGMSMPGQPGMNGTAANDMAMMNSQPGMSMPGQPGMSMPGADPTAMMQDPGAGPGMSIPGGDMAGPGDPGMAGPGDPGGSSGGGNSGPGSAKEPDYDSPYAGANTFLDALDKKDTRVLAEAVAIRSEFEAETTFKRNLFKAIREESLATSDLDQLAELFKDMKIVSRNTPKSTGSLGVIVGKMDKEKYEYRTRTLTMRHEKLGWKVQDFSGPRVQKMPNPKTSQMYKMRQKMQGRKK